MLVRVLLALTLFAALHAMLGAAWVPVGDADVFWVAAAGRELLTSHAVPTTNLFSFSEPNRPWIMHEWLLGPLYALGLARWGAPFFVAVALLVLAAGLWIVLRATLGRAEHWLAGALLACVSTLFFLRRLQTARPTCVALLLPLLFTSLAFAPTFTLARGIACVLLEGLWANTHGSFPLGILLLTAAAIDRPRDRGRRLLAALGSLGATFVNPYGVRLHAFVWNYWSGSAGIFREIHAAIPEFGDMREAWGSLIELPELLGFAVVAIMAVAALCTRTQRWRGLLCVGLLLMAARQARHLELAGLVSCMLLVPWADGWAAGLSAQPEGSAALRGRLVRMISGLSCALGVATFAIAWSVRKPSDWINRELAFVDALPAIEPGAKLYVPFRAAGMALWYGFPRGIRVFYDPRNDCYSVQTLRDFAKLGNAQTTPAEALRILAASGTDAVLIPSTHPLAATLATAVDWRRVPDPRGVVFERRISTAAAPSAAGSTLADAWTAWQLRRSRRAGAPDPPKADAPCRVMHVVSASDHRELLVGPAQCGRGPHRQGASMVDSNLSDTISDLKAHARVLHKLALAGQPSALQRLRALPEWSRAADEAIVAGLQRRHCLGAVARQLGFQNWQHARAVLLGDEAGDFGTLLYPATCHGHWNIWSASYDEAREIRAAHGGYLLAYRRQFLIVDQHYIESMGLDPEAADWTRIGRDWVRPGDLAARARLYRQLVHNALSLRVLRDAQTG